MNLNFSDQNCLTRYNSNALRGETGPNNRNILVLINDKYVFVNANTCTFLRKYIKIILTFIKKTLGYLST